MTLAEERLLAELEALEDDLEGLTEAEYFDPTLMADAQVNNLPTIRYALGSGMPVTAWEPARKNASEADRVLRAVRQWEETTRRLLARLADGSITLDAFRDLLGRAFRRQARNSYVAGRRAIGDLSPLTVAELEAIDEMTLDDVGRLTNYLTAEPAAGGVSSLLVSMILDPTNYLGSGLPGDPWKEWPAPLGAGMKSPEKMATEALADLAKGKTVPEAKVAAAIKAQANLVAKGKPVPDSVAKLAATALRGPAPGIEAAKELAAFQTRMAQYGDAIRSYSNAGEVSALGRAIPAGSALAWWTLGPADHCIDCVRLSDASPFYADMLASNGLFPGSGHTRCGGRCRCRLEYDVPTEVCTDPLSGPGSLGDLGITESADGSRINVWVQEAATCANPVSITSLADAVSMGDVVDDTDAFVWDEDLVTAMRGGLDEYITMADLAPTVSAEVKRRVRSIVGGKREEFARIAQRLEGVVPGDIDTLRLSRYGADGALFHVWWREANGAIRLELGATTSGLPVLDADFLLRALSDLAARADRMGLRLEVNAEMASDGLKKWLTTLGAERAALGGLPPTLVPDFRQAAELATRRATYRARDRFDDEMAAWLERTRPRPGIAPTPVATGVDMLNPRNVDEMVARAETMLPEVAKAVSKTPEEVTASLQAAAERMSREGIVETRLTPSKLQGILDDGRFRTSFEGTKGTTGPLHDDGSRVKVAKPEFRVGTEERLFGYSPAIEHKWRPAYGYLSSANLGAAGDVPDYGNVVVRLKAEVKKRTTVTEGDSLNWMGGGVRAVPAHPMNLTEPRWTGLTTQWPRPEDVGQYQKFVDEQLADIKKHQTLHLSPTVARSPSGFIEAQIHGGVTVADIAEVVFTKAAPSKPLRTSLEAAGIPWRVVKEGNAFGPLPEGQVARTLDEVFPAGPAISAKTAFDAAIPPVEPGPKPGLEQARKTAKDIPPAAAEPGPGDYLYREPKHGWFTWDERLAYFDERLKTGAYGESPDRIGLGYGPPDSVLMFNRGHRHHGAQDAMGLVLYDERGRAKAFMQYGGGGNYNTPAQGFWEMVVRPVGPRDSPSMPDEAAQTAMRNRLLDYAQDHTDINVYDWLKAPPPSRGRGFGDYVYTFEEGPEAALAWLAHRADPKFAPRPAPTWSVAPLEPPVEPKAGIAPEPAWTRMEPMPDKGEAAAIAANLRPEVLTWEDLEGDALLAVSGYTTGSDRFNAWLRGLRPAGPVAEKRLVAMRDGLDSAMRPLPEDVTVVRGITDAKFAKTLQVGGVYDERGFMSTGIAPQAALGAAGPEGTLLQIRLPAGTPALLTSPAELLIGRGTRWRIVGEDFFGDRRVLLLEPDVPKAGIAPEVAVLPVVPVDVTDLMPSTAKLGGAQDKEVLTDIERGIDWIWKPGDRPAVMDSYNLGAEMGLRVVPLNASTFNGVEGTWQYVVPGESVAKRSVAPDESQAIRDVLANPEHAEELVGQQMLDYLIGNYDNHWGNLIVDALGRVWGIDKEDVHFASVLSNPTKANGYLHDPVSAAIRKTFALDYLEPHYYGRWLDALERVDTAALFPSLPPFQRGAVLERIRTAREGYTEMLAEYIEHRIAQGVDIPPRWRAWFDGDRVFPSTPRPGPEPARIADTGIRSHVDDAVAELPAWPDGGRLKADPTAPSLGGTQPKRILVDPTGQQWLFKPTEADAEVTAAAVGHALGIRMPPVMAANFDGSAGALQPIIPDTRSLMQMGAFDDAEVLATIPPDQMAVLAQHAVLDVLIANLDGHAGQWLLDTSGRLWGIDKGMAFAPAVALSPTPATFFGSSGHVFNLARADLEASGLLLHTTPADVAVILDRLDGLSDDAYRALVRDAGPLVANPFGDVDDGVRVLLERKTKAREGWSDFYRALIEEAPEGTVGPEWRAWAKAGGRFDQPAAVVVPAGRPEVAAKAMPAAQPLPSFFASSAEKASVVGNDLGTWHVGFIPSSERDELVKRIEDLLPAATGNALEGFSIGQLNTIIDRAEILRDAGFDLSIVGRLSDFSSVPPEDMAMGIGLTYGNRIALRHDHAWAYLGGVDSPSTVYNDIGGLFAHEYGHALYTSMGMEGQTDVIRLWERVKGSAEGDLSLYAASDAEEWWGEVIAAITAPGYTPGTLPYDGEVWAILATSRTPVAAAGLDHLPIPSKTPPVYAEPPALRQRIARGPYGDVTEMMPVRTLGKYREFDRRAKPLDPKAYEKLRADIKKNGITEPLILEVSVADSTALLIEGNHRLAIAEELGIEWVPVRGYRRKGSFDATQQAKAKPVKVVTDEFGYLPQDLPPSWFVPTSDFNGPLKPLGPPKPPRLPPPVVQTDEEFIAASKVLDDEMRRFWSDAERDAVMAFKYQSDGTTIQRTVRAHEPLPERFWDMAAGLDSATTEMVIPDGTILWRGVSARVADRFKVGVPAIDAAWAPTTERQSLAASFGAKGGAVLRMRMMGGVRGARLDYEVLVQRGVRMEMRGEHTITVGGKKVRIIDVDVTPGQPLAVAPVGPPVPEPAKPFFAPGTQQQYLVGGSDLPLNAPLADWTGAIPPEPPLPTELLKHSPEDLAAARAASTAAYKDWRDIQSGRVTVAFAGSKKDADAAAKVGFHVEKVGDTWMVGKDRASLDALRAYVADGGSTGDDAFWFLAGYSADDLAAIDAYEAMKSGGLRLTGGVIMVEPDGRIWLLAPKNEYAGYQNTHIKGGVDAGETAAQAAVREMREEAGFSVELDGYLGDYVNADRTSMTRFYIGHRTGGGPLWAHPKETHEVRLVTPEEARAMLTRYKKPEERDQRILADAVAALSGTEPSGQFVIPADAVATFADKTRPLEQSEVWWPTPKTKAPANAPLLWPKAGVSADPPVSTAFGYDYHAMKGYTLGPITPPGTFPMYQARVKLPDGTNQPFYWKLEMESTPVVDDPAVATIDKAIAQVKAVGPSGGVLGEEDWDLLAGMLPFDGKPNSGMVVEFENPGGPGMAQMYGWYDESGRLAAVHSASPDPETLESGAIFDAVMANPAAKGKGYATKLLDWMVDDLHIDVPAYLPATAGFTDDGYAFALKWLEHRKALLAASPAQAPSGKLFWANSKKQVVDPHLRFTLHVNHLLTLAKQVEADPSLTGMRVNEQLLQQVPKLREMLVAAGAKPGAKTLDISRTDLLALAAAVEANAPLPSALAHIPTAPMDAAPKVVGNSGVGPDMLAEVMTSGTPIGHWDTTKQVALWGTRWTIPGMAAPVETTWKWSESMDWVQVSLPDPEAVLSEAEWKALIAAATAMHAQVASWVGAGSLWFDASWTKGPGKRTAWMADMVGPTGATIGASGTSMMVATDTAVAYGNKVLADVQPSESAALLLDPQNLPWVQPTATFTLEHVPPYDPDLASFVIQPATIGPTTAYFKAGGNNWSVTWKEDGPLEGGYPTTLTLVGLTGYGATKGERQAVLARALATAVDMMDLKPTYTRVTVDPMVLNGDQAMVTYLEKFGADGGVLSGLIFEADAARAFRDALNLQSPPPVLPWSGALNDYVDLVTVNDAYRSIQFEGWDPVAEATGSMEGTWTLENHIATMTDGTTEMVWNTGYATTASSISAMEAQVAFLRKAVSLFQNEPNFERLIVAAAVEPEMRSFLVARGGVIKAERIVMARDDLLKLADELKSTKPVVEPEAPLVTGTPGDPLFAYHTAVSSKTSFDPTTGQWGITLGAPMTQTSFPAMPNDVDSVTWRRLGNVLEAHALTSSSASGYFADANLSAFIIMMGKVADDAPKVSGLRFTNRTVSQFVAPADGVALTDAQKAFLLGAGGKEYAGGIKLTRAQLLALRDQLVAIANVQPSAVPSPVAAATVPTYDAAAVAKGWKAQADALLTSIEDNVYKTWTAKVEIHWDVAATNQYVTYAGSADLDDFLGAYVALMKKSAIGLQIQSVQFSSPVMKQVPGLKEMLVALPVAELGPFGAVRINDAQTFVDLLANGVQLVGGPSVATPAPAAAAKVTPTPPLAYDKAAAKAATYDDATTHFLPEDPFPVAAIAKWTGQTLDPGHSTGAAVHAVLGAATNPIVEEMKGLNTYTLWNLVKSSQYPGVAFGTDPLDDVFTVRAVWGDSPLDALLRGWSVRAKEAYEGQQTPWMNAVRIDATALEWAPALNALRPYASHIGTDGSLNFTLEQTLAIGKALMEGNPLPRTGLVPEPVAAVTPPVATVPVATPIHDDWGLTAGVTGALTVIETPQKQGFVKYTWGHPNWTQGSVTQRVRHLKTALVWASTGGNSNPTARLHATLRHIVAMGTDLDAAPAIATVRFENHNSLLPSFLTLLTQPKYGGYVHAGVVTMSREGFLKLRDDIALEAGLAGKVAALQTPPPVPAQTLLEELNVNPSLVSWAIEGGYTVGPAAPGTPVTYLWENLDSKTHVEVAQGSIIIGGATGKGEADKAAAVLAHIALVGSTIQPHETLKLGTLAQAQVPGLLATMPSGAVLTADEAKALSDAITTNTAVTWPSASTAAPAPTTDFDVAYGFYVDYVTEAATSATDWAAPTFQYQWAQEQAVTLVVTPPTGYVAVGIADDKTQAAAIFALLAEWSGAGYPGGPLSFITPSLKPSVIDILKAAGGVEAVDNITVNAELAEKMLDALTSNVAFPPLVSGSAANPAGTAPYKVVAALDDTLANEPGVQISALAAAYDKEWLSNGTPIAKGTWSETANFVQMDSLTMAPQSDEAAGAVLLDLAKHAEHLSLGLRVHVSAVNHLPHQTALVVKTHGPYTTPPWAQIEWDQMGGFIKALGGTPDPLAGLPSDPVLTFPAATPLTSATPFMQGAKVFEVVYPSSGPAGKGLLEIEFDGSVYGPPGVLIRGGAGFVGDTDALMAVADVAAWAEKYGRPLWVGDNALADLGLQNDLAGLLKKHGQTSAVGAPAKTGWMVNHPVLFDFVEDLKKAPAVPVAAPGMFGLDAAMMNLLPEPLETAMAQGFVKYEWSTAVPATLRFRASSASLTMGVLQTDSNPTVRNAIWLSTVRKFGDRLTDVPTIQKVMVPQDQLTTGMEALMLKHGATQWATPAGDDMLTMTREQWLAMRDEVENAFSSPSVAGTPAGAINTQTPIAPVVAPPPKAPDLGDIYGYDHAKAVGWGKGVDKVANDTPITRTVDTVFPGGAVTWAEEAQGQARILRIRKASGDEPLVAHLIALTTSGNYTTMNGGYTKGLPVRFLIDKKALTGAPAMTQMLSASGLWKETKEYWVIDASDLSTFGDALKAGTAPWMPSTPSAPAFVPAAPPTATPIGTVTGTIAGPTSAPAKVTPAFLYGYDAAKVAQAPTHGGNATITVKVAKGSEQQDKQIWAVGPVKGYWSVSPTGGRSGLFAIEGGGASPEDVRDAAFAMLRVVAEQAPQPKGFFVKPEFYDQVPGLRQLILDAGGQESDYPAIGAAVSLDGAAALKLAEALRTNTMGPIAPGFKTTAEYLGYSDLTAKALMTSQPTAAKGGLTWSVDVSGVKTATTVKVEGTADWSTALIRDLTGTKVTNPLAFVAQVNWLAEQGAKEIRVGVDVFADVPAIRNWLLAVGGKVDGAVIRLDEDAVSMARRAISKDALPVPLGGAPLPYSIVDELNANADSVASALTHHTIEPKGATKASRFTVNGVLTRTTYSESAENIHWRTLDRGVGSVGHARATAAAQLRVFANHVAQHAGMERLDIATDVVDQLSGLRAVLRKYGATLERTNGEEYWSLARTGALKMRNDLEAEWKLFDELTGVADLEQRAGVVKWPSVEELTYDSTKTGKLGGQSKKGVYIDQDGNEWLFKPGYSGRGMVTDVAAVELGKRLGLSLAPSRIYRLEYGGKVVEGSLQKMVPGVIRRSNSEFSDAEMQQILRHSVLDWVMNNDDAHVKNWVIGPDGTVWAIDKTRAYKSWKTGQDVLDATSLGQGGTPAMAPTLFAFFLAARSDPSKLAAIHPATITPTLRKLQAISDDDFMRLMRPVAERTEHPAYKGNTEQLLKEMVARKNSAATDLETFIREEVKRASKAGPLPREWADWLARGGQFNLNATPKDLMEEEFAALTAKYGEAGSSVPGGYTPAARKRAIGAHLNGVTSVIDTFVANTALRNPKVGQQVGGHGYVTRATSTLSAEQVARTRGIAPEGSYAPNYIPLLAPQQQYEEWLEIQRWQLLSIAHGAPGPRGSSFDAALRAAWDEETATFLVVRASGRFSTPKAAFDDLVASNGKLAKSYGRLQTHWGGQMKTHGRFHYSQFITTEATEITRNENEWIVRDIRPEQVIRITNGTLMSRAELEAWEKANKRPWD